MYLGRVYALPGCRLSSPLQIAEQELQPKMQQWHNTAAQASVHSYLSETSTTDGSQQPAEPGLEVQDGEYDELVRDVAARIIQTYWGRYKARRRTFSRPRSSDRVLAPRMDPPLRPRQFNGPACHTPEPSGTVLLLNFHGCTLSASLSLWRCSV